ncbi:putative hexose carrier protein [Saitoella complicata NRRL Y-17804]|uniref:Major facilitator superfamily (MFS) profile domain-containing protein n=1 Tax=Saitoella complicata (strain BCRC 22490 / CBS 7301 / JCM 7358 / NBRC 10748 / NRRL Y-17804) TaxID=698492 RepID=A0A0E9NCZ6_SAICN|nr:putative hexose carrier protein [Saitoella complicata NRRL Y-17804]ODQ52394.1 putative hexose carrier protein [Saitoella complicata NRRL Y-17804]GAO47581.1 hypothetical protein G7K_1783-t1 [Saitoella complicata NRRL Y-17804]
MSPDPTFCGLKGQSLVYLVTFCCSIGFLLFGYDLGFMGGVTTSPLFLETFGNPDAALLGFMVSSYDIGCLLGAVLSFFIGDHLGRRMMIVAGGIWVLVGAVLQASSFSMAQFLVGRIIGGVGMGHMTTAIPIWLTESASAKKRGRMMAMQLSNLIMGLIIANWVDYGMAKIDGSIQWRFPVALQCIFCVLVMSLCMFLPESPRWLMQKGREVEARKSLAALRGGALDSEIVESEFRDIQTAIMIESHHVSSWMDIFRDGGISGFTRVMTGFNANFFQQLSGVNVMSSLGPYIFQHSVGFDRNQALMVSGGQQIFYFLSSIIPWFVIDRAGRRKLFMLGSFGMGVCMALSAVFIGIGGKGLGYAAVVVLYIYQTFFTLGWQSTLWIYPSEILPLKLRLRGGAIAVVSQWLFTFVVVEITPPMITNITYKSYIVFAAFNFLAIVVVYFTFPETANRPLEAVDLLFADRDGKRPSIWRVVQDSVSKDFDAEYELHRLEQQNSMEIGKKTGEEYEMDEDFKGMSSHVENVN